MADSNPQRADALTRQLKDTLSHRRLRPWKPVLALIGVCTLVMAGMIYWLYPRTRPGSLEIVAFDGLFTADESPTAEAQMFPSDEEEGTSRLRGNAVVFQDKHKTVTDEHGRASIEWSTKEEASDFFVRYISTDPRPANVNDAARIFVWPKDAKLLIVDAEETLVGDKLDEQAAAALSKASADGWRIVYLTSASNKPAAWRSARAWIVNNPQLPTGPVLGRRPLPSDAPTSAARRDLLQGLRKFKGKRIAVVKTPDAALQCKEFGIDAILVGNAEPPAGALHAAGWADVPGKLK
jgi:hypothetical protein